MCIDGYRGDHCEEGRSRIVSRMEHFEFEEYNIKNSILNQIVMFYFQLKLLLLKVAMIPITKQLKKSFILEPIIQMLSSIIVLGESPCPMTGMLS